MSSIYTPLHVRFQWRVRHLVRNQLPQLVQRIPRPVSVAFECVGVAVCAVILVPIYVVVMLLLDLSARRRRRIESRARMSGA